MTNTHCRKAYVSVNLDVDEEGVCHPRFIRWENGLTFRLTKSCINAVPLPKR